MLVAETVSLSGVRGGRGFKHWASMCQVGDGRPAFVDAPVFRQSIIDMRCFSDAAGVLVDLLVSVLKRLLANTDLAVSTA